MIEYLPYISVFLLISTTILCAYYLLLKEIEIKKVITFAIISLFSSTIMLIGERITTVRLPVLGEIVAKAKYDASQIEELRKSLEKKLIATNKKIDVEKNRLRLNYLKNEIEKLEYEISTREEERLSLLQKVGPDYDVNEAGAEAFKIQVKIINPLTDRLKVLKEEYHLLNSVSDDNKNIAPIE